MDRGAYVKRFNDLIAAVSDSSKEEARNIMRNIVDRILADKDDYYFRRFCDDIMVAWYDTYKRGGKGPWLPRETAGIPRHPE